MANNMTHQSREELRETTLEKIQEEYHIYYHSIVSSNLSEDKKYAAISGWWIHKVSEQEKELRTLILNIKPSSQPLEPYLSVVKTGNMDAMFDWAYHRAISDVLALLTNPTEK